MESNSVINVSTQFILAGEAIFTLSNGRGEHETFKVYRAKPNAQFPTQAYFAKVLTGPDNSNDYMYLGQVIPPTLIDPNPRVKLTTRSTCREDSRSIKALRFSLRAIWQVEAGTYTLPPGYTIKHADRCGKCGRPLTTPTSLSTGFGEECASQLGIEWSERTQIPNGLLETSDVVSQ